MAEQTIPVPEKYVDRFKELLSLDTQIYDLQAEHKLKATSLWTEVEKDLDVRGKALKFNKEKFTITIVDDTEQKDREMLKKIREGRATPYNQSPIVMDKNQMGKPLPSIHLPKVPLWQRIKNSFK